MSVEKENSIKYWNDMHAKLNYERDKIAIDDWLEKFEDIIVAAKLPATDLGGHLILRVNSINDVNHCAGQGTEIEHHLFETDDKRLKRFFDDEDIRYFFKDFEIEYMNEEIMSRYKLEKRLYRVCVRTK